MRHLFLYLSMCCVAFVVSAGCNKAEAEKRAQEARDEAEREAAKRLADAKKLADDLQPWVQGAKDAKVELDKVFPTKMEYELVFAVPEEGDEKLKAHEERLRKMDRVEVDGFTVGYEERKERSLGGKSFERHFRATWVREKQVVGVSYYSKQGLDAAAFAKLLQKLVPISNEVFRHVQLKRGDTTP